VRFAAGGAVRCVLAPCKTILSESGAPSNTATPADAFIAYPLQTTSYRTNDYKLSSHSPVEVGVDEGVGGDGGGV